MVARSVFASNYTVCRSDCAARSIGERPSTTAPGSRWPGELVLGYARVRSEAAYWFSVASSRKKYLSEVDQC